MAAGIKTTLRIGQRQTKKHQCGSIRNILVSVGKEGKTEVPILFTINLGVIPATSKCLPAAVQANLKFKKFIDIKIGF